MATLVKIVLLIVVAGGVIFLLRTVRPKLHEQRMRCWEEAGLLPHQVDPYAPRDDEPGPAKDHED